MGFGGDFTLTDQNGQSFSSKKLRGKVVFLFFGYTSCPHICPATMSRLEKVYELLGKKRGNLTRSLETVFITVDPEKDTPAVLKAFLAKYNIKATGLTGSEKEIKKTVKRYQGLFEKRPKHKQAKGERVDHTSFVYLLDRKGQVVSLFRDGEKPVKIARVTLRALLTSARR